MKQVPEHCFNFIGAELWTLLPIPKFLQFFSVVNMAKIRQSDWRIVYCQEFGINPDFQSSRQRDYFDDSDYEICS